MTIVRLRRRAGTLVCGAIVAGACAVGAACAAPSQARGADSEASAGASAAVVQTPLVIDHLAPRRDSVGTRPARFEWTAVAGADRYAIGLWNEVDRLMWRQDDLAATSVAWPAGLDVEPGTYFWSVSGIREGREVGHSGLAAFVIEE
jgi:hypothetical protein